jgi:predicted metal-dependent hydrolase
MKPTPQCEHRFVHYDTKNNKEYFVTTGMSLYTRIDYFYCEKCLEEKEKRKSESSRYAPEWY